MKERSRTRVGNPIRRPPGGGESSGYASSSGYSSGGSVTSSSVGRAESIMDRMALARDDAGDGGARHPPSSAAENARNARTFLALACLWPLLFLLIPPGKMSAKHVALLSTGMDTMDSRSLSQHMRRIEDRAHGRIDLLRSRVSGKISAKTQFLRREMRSLLKRTDVVGYGPARPRAAVVVVVPSPPPAPAFDPRRHVNHNYEEEKMLNGALEAVESIFRTADRNRIFMVTVVMDGRGKLANFEARLQDIDSGRTAHRHGDKVHTHDHRGQWKVKDEKKGTKVEGKEGAHTHSEKIHAIYSHESMGVTASRRKGVQFINILAQKHEEAGLKKPEEDLILLFLRCDSRLREFEDGQWLDDVTDALILSPAEEDGIRAGSTPENDHLTKDLLPANAVSFMVDWSSTDTEGNVEVHPSKVGETLTFDQSLHPVHATATAQQMSLSNGESYPAPLASAATAMRLATYNALPAADDQLSNHYSADIELSFNLWMCADGIDVLGSGRARVAVDPQVLSPYEKARLTGPLAARIVSAWMSGHGDENFSDGILQEVAASSATTYINNKQAGHAKDHAMMEQRELLDKTQELKHTLVRIASEAKQSASFPAGLSKKCRPFSWYAQHLLHRMDIHGEDGAHASLAGQAVTPVSEQRAPSEPLNEERMAIVSRASPVDLAYVDVSGGHAAHPHRGAEDERGNLGYVHDETALARNPPPFEIKGEEDHARLCREGDPNWKMLTEKVFVDLAGHGAAEKRAEHGLARGRRAKIFCLVYTTEKNHNRIPAIRETWGQKCDGFMVASTKTDIQLGTVNIPHEGPEEYNNIWQKVRSMWSYVYDNYYEKYDFFHIGGDDLYLIVDNLRLYVESEEIQAASNGGHYLPDGTENSQTPLFLGRRFAENGNRDRMFLSGGSGYTMNKAALKALVVDGLPQCFPHMHTFSEDVMIATCFRKMDVLPYDTKDQAGGERYMPFQPGHHLTYRPPKNPKDDWYSNYSVDVKWGIDHCASKSVAFHYIKGDLMRRMHAILYHYC